jgi:DNA-directed RNA polymerase specialized sigma24 family protein
VADRPNSPRGHTYAAVVQRGAADDRNSSDAEDLVQETPAPPTAVTPDSSRAPACVLLFRIMTNQYINTYKRQRRPVETDLADVEDLYLYQDQQLGL